MIEKEVYKSIFEYINQVLAEYTSEFYIDKPIDVEYRQADLFGVLIQRLGFDTISTNLLGEKTVAFKFVLTSNQKKFGEYEEEKKINVSTFLDGINDYIGEKFETEKPVAPTGCDAIDLKMSTGGIQTNTDNSVSYKSDYEFIYHIK